MSVFFSSACDFFSDTSINMLLWCTWGDWQHVNQRPLDAESTLTRSCWSGRSGAGKRPVTNRWCVGLLHVLLPVTETKHTKQNDRVRLSCNERHLVRMQAFHLKPMSINFISVMQRTMPFEKLLVVEHRYCELLHFLCVCFGVFTCKITFISSLLR